MTVFNVPLPDAVKRLEEAAKTLDEVLQWDTTDEGPDYWEDIRINIIDKMDEARTAAGGGATPPSTGNTATPAGNTQAMPPLHSLSPKTKQSFVPPPLHELMGKKRTTAVAKVTPSTKEELVHIWNNGGALCGLAGSPANWPVGHYRVGLDERQKATCVICAAKVHELTPTS